MESKPRKIPLRGQLVGLFSGQELGQVQALPVQRLRVLLARRLGLQLEVPSGMMEGESAMSGISCV